MARNAYVQVSFKLLVLGSAIFQIKKELPARNERLQKSSRFSGVTWAWARNLARLFSGAQGARHRFFTELLGQNGDLKESKRRDVEQRSLGISLKVFNSYLFHSKIVICFFSNRSIQKHVIPLQENMCFFHVFFYMTFWSIFRYFSNETNTCFPPSSKIQHPHIRLGYEAEQTDKCHGEESFTWSAKQPFFKGTEVWWFPTIYKWMETRFQAVNKTYTEQLQAMASNGSNMRFHTMILWIFDPGDVFFFSEGEEDKSSFGQILRWLCQICFFF